MAPTSKSGFRGVAPSGKKWRAYISKNGRTYHLGVYRTAREAARVYDLAASQLYGKSATTNRSLGLL